MKGKIVLSRQIVAGNLARENYLALHQAADVGLDTFGFSGGSTTLDALSVGLPFVSLEGAFLRGRQSAAIMRQLGQGGNVAQSVDQFVDLARSVSRATAARGGAMVHAASAQPSSAVVSSAFLSAGQFFRALRVNSAN